MDLRLADLTDRVAFCDPASGSKKETVRRTRARSAIVVIAGDALSRVFVLSSWADRCTPDALIDQIIATNDLWHPRAFGIEANAMQSLFAGTLGRVARDAGKSLPLVPTTQSTKLEKGWRIRTTLQPVIAAGRLFIPTAHLGLRAEITSFPMSPTKDLVDALASAIAMLPMKATRRDTDEEGQARLRYLRESGASPAYIESVQRELERIA